MHPPVEGLNNTDWAKECAKDYRALRAIYELSKGGDEAAWMVWVKEIAKERLDHIDTITNSKPRGGCNGEC